MRTVQTVLFYAGVVSFLGAILGIGQDIGDILWRLGVAIMLTNLCMVKLWPADSEPHRQGQST